MNRLLLLTGTVAASICLIQIGVFGQSSSLSIIKAGTTLRVNLETAISSRVNSVNDTFIARLTEPVMNGETQVLPAATRLEGRIVAVRRAGLFARNGRLEIRFERIFPFDSAPREMFVSQTGQVGPQRVGTTMKIATTAVPIAGTIGGGLAGGKRGAIIGGGLGSFAGILFLIRGREVIIDPAQTINIVLDRDLILPVNDF